MARTTARRLVATNHSATDQGETTGFTAGLPAVNINGAESTGASTAVVDGDVNPVGQTTSYEAQYDLASSAWCTGGSGSPAHTTSPQPLAYTDDNYHDVSVSLNGLTPGQAYCVELVATNTSATAHSDQAQFNAGLPVAHTYDATETGASTATVDGDVNPVGQATTYEVQYDVASSSWCTSGGYSGSPAHSTSPQTLGYTDNTAHNVSVTLSGLTGGQSYCAQLLATNGSGTGPGGEVRFTAGVPIASTDDAQATGASTAVVDGSVNPEGQTTTYEVQYDVASSSWCTSGGYSGSPAHSTSPQTLGSTDDTGHSVSVTLSGLTAAQSYCAPDRCHERLGYGQRRNGSVRCRSTGG